MHAFPPYLKSAVLSLLALIAATSSAQDSSGWRDPSPHKIQFVTVEEGVQLEVLDWGGLGRNVVLLAGSGNTAHVFDGFAEKLTSFCHVYGITRAASVLPLMLNRVTRSNAWPRTSWWCWIRSRLVRRCSWGTLRPEVR